jgi:hypothetical protein
VVAAGQAGSTVLSDDAGVTFTPIGRSLDGVYSRVRSGQGALWATGSVGRLARSTDGGATWANVGVSTSENVRDVAFPTATNGYALDDSGTVLRTDNSGASWRLLDTGSTRRPNALASPSANVVLLFGPRGILRSGDGGDQFDEVTARRRAPGEPDELRPRRQRAVRVRAQDARALDRRRPALDEAPAADSYDLDRRRRLRHREHRLAAGPRRAAVQHPQRRPALDGGARARRLARAGHLLRPARARAG